MKKLWIVLTAVLLPACATLRGGGGGDDAERARLWRQGHEALDRDSFRIAEASFQRLASEFPDTYEGHEARFYMGVVALEPRRGVDLQAAEEHFGIYLADAARRPGPSYHEREAESLHQLTRQLRSPCDARVPGLACADTVVQTRTVGRTGDPAPPPAAGAAEAARLRRQLAERDETIRELREELQRIRNTLAPRRPQQDE